MFLYSRQRAELYEWKSNWNQDAYVINEVMEKIQIAIIVKAFEFYKSF